MSFVSLLRMKKEILIFILLSVFVCALGFANETPKAINSKAIILSGKITDIKSNEYLVGVKITCENSNKTVYSDLDGNFLIYIELNNDEKPSLEISQIGYETKTLILQEISPNSSRLLIDLKSL